MELRTDQRAAEGQALAGEHAGGVVRQLLHHARHEADLTAADADVAGRHVGVGADVAIQLAHEGLAEAHHLARAAALGIEVRAALAAAHRQRGERVLEESARRRGTSGSTGSPRDGSAGRPCRGRSPSLDGCW